MTEHPGLRHFFPENPSAPLPHRYTTGAAPPSVPRRAGMHGARTISHAGHPVQTRRYPRVQSGHLSLECYHGRATEPALEEANIRHSKGKTMLRVQAADTLQLKIEKFRWFIDLFSSERRFQASGTTGAWPAGDADTKIGCAEAMRPAHPERKFRVRSHMCLRIFIMNFAGSDRSDDTIANAPSLLLHASPFYTRKFRSPMHTGLVVPIFCNPATYTIGRRNDSQEAH